MTPHSFPFTPDPALKFGCGRYRQEEHLLERSAEEILRFGRHPLFVCDATSRAIAFDAVAASLRDSGMEPRILVHDGFCCLDDALARAGEGALDGIDVILGCGGGVVIDFAKCLADVADVPIVTIPTSSAQCCAYTPIAVCYTREGRYEKTALFRREIAAALLDMTILSRQPQRLLVAGALDAMAKKIEIEFWESLDGENHEIHENSGVGLGKQSNLSCISCVSWLNNTLPLPVLMASSVADLIYGFLDRNLDAAVADLARGEPTPLLRDVFFASIVGAGIVSGISGGKRQTALAHRFYFYARQRLAALGAAVSGRAEKDGPPGGRPLPENSVVFRFTHGELVAVGLVLQLAYYGRFDEAAALAARLRGWGLAASMADLGLPHGEAEVAGCFGFLAATREMKTAGEAALPQLRKAIASVF